MNNKIDEAQRMIEQIDDEIKRSTKIETNENLMLEKISWQNEIHCYRNALNDVALHTSEIEI
ncbi:MAG: hypothetical protein WAV28_07040 [Sedimentisphaerales bacterium]